MEYTKNGIIVNGKEITLKEISENVLLKKIEDDDLVLITIHWKESRGFDGITEQQVFTRRNAEEFCKEFTGFQVSFGEISGKHSDVYGDIDKEDIIVDDNRKVVLSFLLSYPGGNYHDYSFIQEIDNCLYDYNDDDLTEEECEELRKKLSKLTEF